MSLEVIQLWSQTGSQRRLLYHVFRDAIDILLSPKTCDRIEVQVLVTFEQSGTDAFQLLSVLRHGTIVFSPDEVEHFLDPFLENDQFDTRVSVKDE